MAGGAKLGSGRPRMGRRDHVRSERLTTAFRPGEAADLAEIARQWGVPRSLVLWSLAHDALARIRGVSPTLGEAGRGLAAAALVLRDRALAEVPKGAADGAEPAEPETAPAGPVPRALLNLADGYLHTAKPRDVATAEALATGIRAWERESGIAGPLPEALVDALSQLVALLDGILEGALDEPLDVVRAAIASTYPTWLRGERELARRREADEAESLGDA